MASGGNWRHLSDSRTSPRNSPPKGNLEADGAVVPRNMPQTKTRQAYDVTDYDVTDSTDSGVAESFPGVHVRELIPRDIKSMFREPDTRIPELNSVGYVSCSVVDSAPMEAEISEQMEQLTVNPCCVSEQPALPTEDVADTSTESPETQSIFITRLEEFYQQDEDGDTKLHLAVINQNLQVATYLILAAISYSVKLLEIQNSERQSALHLAIATDQPSIVRLLVNCGASLNVRDRHGRTPIMLACARGMVRCLREMVRPFSNDERQQIDNYCQEARIPQVQLCNYHIPDVSVIDYDGRSCLHLVHTWKNAPHLAPLRLQAIDFLINTCGADINVQERNGGDSLLHLAVRENDTELFTYLVSQKSTDFSLAAYSRRTALDIAHTLCRREMYEQLLRVAGQHSADYRLDSSSSDDSDDDMDDFDLDDLVVGGRKVQTC